MYVQSEQQISKAYHFLMFHSASDIRLDLLSVSIIDTIPFFIACCLSLPSIHYTYLRLVPVSIGARRGAVVEALRYKPEDRGFD
jgi:hypothetical protein